MESQCDRQMRQPPAVIHRHGMYQHRIGPLDVRIANHVGVEASNGYSLEV